VDNEEFAVLISGFIKIEQNPRQLRLEFQSHEPTNAVFLNGHFLGYLPVKDWTYSWVSTKFFVPGNFLQFGLVLNTILQFPLNSNDAGGIIDRSIEVFYTYR
jgi:hypothetical protein